MDDPKTCKLLLLPSISLKVNLDSSVSENKKGELKAIKKAVMNDRDSRVRPESTQKSDGSTFTIQSSQVNKNNDFAKDAGAFGGEW